LRAEQFQWFGVRLNAQACPFNVRLLLAPSRDSGARLRPRLRRDFGPPIYFPHRKDAIVGQPAAEASAPRAVAAKAKPSLAASKTMKVVWNLPISSVFKVKAHAQIDDRTISDLMGEIINFYYANHPDKTL
jgi:hypothetical protein